MAKITVPVLGLHCVVCARNVEATVNDLDGVNSANVNFSANTLTVDFDTKVITPEKIKTAVQNRGYDIVIENDDSDRQQAEDEVCQNIRKRLIVAWIIAIPVMAISLTDFAETILGKIVCAVLSAVVLAYSGKDFYIRAWKMLKNKTAGMDTLVSMSTATAWCFSLLLLLFPDFFGSNNVYFDSAVMIIAFVLTGHFLEEKAKASTTSAIRSLVELQPSVATVIGADGKETETAISAIKAGNHIRVKPGSRIPVDGVVSQGESYVDESMLTGESMSVAKQIGDYVYAGTMNGNGGMVVAVEKDSESTFLSQIVAMVKEAQGSKAPVQRIADRISKYFTAIVVVVSLITLAIWLVVGGAEYIPTAIICAVSVLVIACPCALGLATPTAITVGIGKAAENHILIKDATALEKTGKVSLVVFDKTGTITEGKPTVVSKRRNIHTTDKNLGVLLAMETLSEHPLAATIVAHLKMQEVASGKVENFKVVYGKGVEAISEGEKYWAGSERFAIEKEVDVKSVGNTGGTTVFFGKGTEVLATITLADKIKDTSIVAIDKLRKMGIRTVMLTGDSKAAAAIVANDADFTEYHSEMLPGDKDAYVRHRQSEGRIVAMVGDGINDSQALARADVSIAMGTGTDVAIETSMMTLTSSDLRLLPKAIQLSRRTMRTVKENLFWAFIYNVIGIPVAAGILFPIMGVTLDPMWASAAMAVSSITVVLNSLRLKLTR